jgi:BMFP domain-containing protein YqiC
MSNGQTLGTTPKQLQIPEQIDRTRAELDRLHEKVEELLGRLQNVSRSEPDGRDAEEVSTDIVVLAGTIRGFSESIESARAKIEHLLNTLEL